MLADLLQEILTSAALSGYKHPNGDPIHLIIARDNGVVYRGELVDPEEWIMINTVAGQGTTWSGRRAVPAPGSWPQHVNLPADQQDIHNQSKAAREAAGKIDEEAIREAAKKAAREVDGDTAEKAAEEAVWKARKAAAREHEPQHTMIFMTMVEFLSGDRWVTGSSMATDTNKVVACGEQYS